MSSDPCGGLPAEDVARACLNDGLNCADSVLRSLPDSASAIPTGACGGFRQGLGGSGCACGALIGGTLAIASALQSEESPAAPAEVDALVARYHDAFVARWGSTCCRVLKRGQREGSDEWLAHCAEITESSAALVAELLRERQATSVRDWRATAGVVRRALLDALSGAAIAALAAVAANAAGSAAAIAVLAGSAAGAALGATMESGSPARRRAGRALRAVGAASAGLLALAPRAAGLLLAGGGPAATAATVAVALPAIVLGVWALWDFKRFR